MMLLHSAIFCFVLVVLGVAVDSLHDATPQVDANWNDVVDSLHSDNGPIQEFGDSFPATNKDQREWGDGDNSFVLKSHVGVSSDPDLHRINRRSTDTVDWNLLVDNLLAQAKQQIIAEGKDEVPIPDIDEGFEKRLGFIKVRGKFEGREGRVNSISSIHRTGDVSFSGEPGSFVTLTAHLGFSTLRVRYEHYKARLLDVGPNGRIEASVSSNSVRLRVRLNTGETSCSVVLEEAKVVDLGRIDVGITGLGPLNWLSEKIVEWVAQKKRGDIIASIDDALTRSLTRTLENFPCEKHLLDFQV